MVKRETDGAKGRRERLEAELAAFDAFARLEAELAAFDAFAAWVVGGMSPAETEDGPPSKSVAGVGQGLPHRDRAEPYPTPKPTAARGTR